MTRSWTRCPRPPTHASSFIHQPALFLQPLDVIGRCAPSLTGCCIEQQPNHSLQQPCTQTLSLLLLPPSLQGVAHHHCQTIIDALLDTLPNTLPYTKHRPPTRISSLIYQLALFLLPSML